MKHVTLPGGEVVPSMGQGTWKMGERAERRSDEIASLRAGVELGMTLVDTAARAIQNPTPCLSIAGISRNMGRDGRTYQKVAPEWSAMFAVSGRSRHSQTIPKTDTSGSDATSAPTPGYRFARVETKAINTPEMAALRMKYSIRFNCQSACLSAMALECPD